MAEAILAVRGLGIKGLLQVDEWKERIAENPANKDRILAMDPDEFLRVILRCLRERNRQAALGLLLVERRLLVVRPLDQQPLFRLASQANPNAREA